MKTAELRALWMLAFGDSEQAVDSFFTTAYAPDRCRYLEEDGHIAASLYWLDAECCGRKVAYIYGVATHPDHRGKGLCRKLMALTHEVLHQQGYAGALLMPAEPGLRKMYASFGYRECSGIREFTCTAGEESVLFHPVSLSAYAALRREFLPRGGLLQEGENLRYLTTYAQLYAGEDFLLTAVHETDRLFGMELLGNADRAAGILRAMGYAEGTFRTPGEEIPFSMYYPLEPDALMPTYLGLAFD